MVQRRSWSFVIGECYVRLNILRNNEVKTYKFENLNLIIQIKIKFSELIWTKSFHCSQTRDLPLLKIYPWVISIVREWILKKCSEFPCKDLYISIVARSSVHFENIINKKWSYLFMAFNISIVTSTDKAIVIGWGSLNTLQSIPLKSAAFELHCKWCV